MINRIPIIQWYRIFLKISFCLSFAAIYLMCLLLYVYVIKRGQSLGPVIVHRLKGHQWIDFVVTETPSSLCPNCDAFRTNRLSTLLTRQQYSVAWIPLREHAEFRNSTYMRIKVNPISHPSGRQRLYGYIKVHKIPKMFVFVNIPSLATFSSQPVFWNAFLCRQTSKPGFTVVDNQRSHPGTKFCMNCHT